MDIFYRREVINITLEDVIKEGKMKLYNIPKNKIDEIAGFDYSTYLNMEVLPKEILMFKYDRYYLPLHLPTNMFSLFIEDVGYLKEYEVKDYTNFPYLTILKRVEEHLVTQIIENNIEPFMMEREIQFLVKQLENIQGVLNVYKNR